MTTTHKRVIGRLVGTVSYALLTVVLAGCGGGNDEAAPTAPPTVRTTVTTTVEPTTTGCAAVVERVGSDALAYGAAARRDLRVYDRPGGRPGERFGKLNANGVPTVFGVVARRVEESCEPSWYRVRLPRRPNRRLAWVRAADVTVGAVRTRILVDLSERRVTLFRSGRRVLSTPAAVGSSSTPTPTGTFYVDQRLYSGDPTGPFGPSAVGIAAYSEVLTGWAQGGPIAIHGTNRPDLIGQAVSNGCVRVRNDVIKRIFGATLSGTPVVIQE
jgi:L,D-transpeptidase catalytic domain